MRKISDEIIVRRSNKKKTHEEYVEEVKLKNPNVVVVGTYIDARTKIAHRCNLCGNEWNASPTNILHGHWCKSCSLKEAFKTHPQTQPTLRKSHEQFVKQAKISNPNITVLGDYTGAKNSILCKCNVCDFEWSPQAHSILSGCGCPKCAGRHKTTEEFKREIYDINPDIEIISEYINATTMMRCKCKICGHIWNTKANNLRYTGCPQCKESVGERKIRTILSKNPISFTRNKTFDDLRGIKGKLLSYDFYLPEYNLLIEFQGKQHEQPIEYFGGETQFKIQQEHDKRKREYAEKII